MNGNYLNEKINHAIRQQMPKGTNTVNFLMDLLNLSKESTYRRLRNEISFTTMEVALLTNKLGISVDDIFIEMDKESKASSDSNSTNDIAPADAYIRMMRTSIDTLNSMSGNKNVRIFYVGNKVPNGFLFHFPMLSKLRYIRWIHQMHNLTINSKFSDIIVPRSVENMQNEYLNSNKKINQGTYIFDENIIQSILNIIKFYYHRHLITNNEVLGMQTELFSLVNQLENISRTGKNVHNTDNLLYLSDLNIEANIILFESEGNMSTHFLTSDKKTIVTSNPRVFEEQKTWINSLLRFSALITQSNEILQTNFFGKQNNLIETQLNELIQ